MNAPTVRLAPATVIRLKKFLLLPVVLSYIGVATAAAWPEPLVPGRWQWVQGEARDLLSRVRVRAHAQVFGGRGMDRKRRTLSLLVYGERPDGSLRRLYSSYEGPRAPAMRLRENDFDIMLKRLMDNDRMHALRRPGGEKATVEEMRRSGTFDRISRFFGLSPLFDNEGVERIYMVWDFETISYSSGEIFPLLAVVHGYDISRHERITNSLPTPQRLSDGTVTLITAGSSL